MSLLCNRILLHFDDLGLFFPSLIISFYRMNNENHPIMIGTSACSGSTFFSADFCNLGFEVSRKSSRPQVFQWLYWSVLLPMLVHTDLTLILHIWIVYEFNERLWFSIFLTLSANLTQKLLFKPMPQKNTFATFVWYRVVNEHLHGNVAST